MGYQEQLEKSRGAALKISKTAISEIAISNSRPPFFELWQSNSWALGHVHIFFLAQPWVPPAHLLLECTGYL